MAVRGEQLAHPGEGGIDIGSVCGDGGVAGCGR